MTIDKNTINELIPLLVQGKLDSEVEGELLAMIVKSPELQSEFAFWKGVSATRREMSRFDFSSHLLPEVLDRYASGKVNQFSAEYSEIVMHLKDCKSCSQDVELLKLVLNQVAEDELVPVPERKPGIIRSILGIPSTPAQSPASAPAMSRWLAPVLTALVVVVAAILVVNRSTHQTVAASIVLEPKFEKRQLGGRKDLPIYPVPSNADVVAIGFRTDRVDLPQFSYEIRLAMAGGDSLFLSDAPLQCTPSQYANDCQITVSDEALLFLKRGGTFELSIRERFPAGADLVANEYQYPFEVIVEKK